MLFGCRVCEKENLALPQNSRRTLQTCTDDIRRHHQLFSWLNDDASTLLLVKDTFDSTARVAVFGAKLADHVFQEEPQAVPIRRGPLELMS